MASPPTPPRTPGVNGVVDALHAKLISRVVTEWPAFKCSIHLPADCANLAFLLKVETPCPA